MRMAEKKTKRFNSGMMSGMGRQNNKDAEKRSETKRTKGMQREELTKGTE